MDEASEELKFARTRLELDHQLARLGLKGPLWAAWAKLLAIAAVVVVLVLFYGAFILQVA